MTHRRGVLLIPILVLILSGCFRQASESIEPVNESLSDTSQQVVPTTVVDTPVSIPTDEPDTVPTTEPEPTTADDGTPQIAVTASTDVPIATPTTVPSATTAPTQDAATDGGSPVEPVPLESPTSQFITPQASTSDAITTPTPLPSATIDPTPTDVDPSDITVDLTDSCVYEVQRGDTLFRIAVNNNTTVDAIVAANPNINPNVIIPGDEIIIPDCEPDDSEETDDGADEDTTVDEDEDEDTTVVGAPGELIHIVAPGETLSTIAQQYGVTIASIIEANSLTNPNRLSVDQELIIPQE